MLIWRKFFRGKRSILRFIIKAQVPIEVLIFRQRERESYSFSQKQRLINGWLLVRARGLLVRAIDE